MSPSIQDGPTDGEQLLHLTKYTRTHSGTRTEFGVAVFASKGEASVHSWVKDYLSEGKEDLYIRALRNLYRKLDFMELNQSLDMSEMTEDEYDNELVTNEDKYLIPAPSGTPTLQQIIQITDILKRLGREKNISVDEVSEMFSLEMEKAMEVLHEK